jgi:hypothetical protein
MNDALALIRLLTDAVIVLTVLEGAGLAIYHRATGKGLPVQAYLLNLLSGLWLMLALRSALHGAGAVWIAACLAVAGLAHASDLWSRLRRRPG